MSHLYLSPQHADVWFLIDRERIPCRKIFLRAMSDYFVRMFDGEWYNEDIIDFTNVLQCPEDLPEYNHQISADSFKEFLKFAYDVPRKLTMHNIRGVIDLAMSTLSPNYILIECEEFLQRSITNENIFKVYRLATLYYPNLQTELIAVHMENALKSKHFTQLRCIDLQELLLNDSFAYEEKDIFNACIGWAKAACRRNGLDPSSEENLRSQLNVDHGNLLHQLRFTSMTSKDAATCVRSYPSLFTRDELREIISMVGHHNEFQPKNFNWIPRLFNCRWNDGQLLDCSRFKKGDKGEMIVTVKKCETTRFTCNRRIILESFKCELHSPNTKSILVQINEINSDEYSVERCSNREIIAEFHEERTPRSFLAYIQLHNAILLRPNYTYDISVTFLHQMVNMQRNSTLKQKVRIDHDIVIRFDRKRRGIVASLSIRRLDNRKLFRKIMYYPKFWIWIISILSTLCCGAAFYIWPQPFIYVYHKIWEFALRVLYILIGLFLLFVCIALGIAQSTRNHPD